MDWSIRNEVCSMTALRQPGDLSVLRGAERRRGIDDRAFASLSFDRFAITNKVLIAASLCCYRNGDSFFYWRDNPSNDCVRVFVAIE